MPAIDGAPTEPGAPDEALRQAAAHPGVRAPSRTRDVDAHGVRIRVVEWGDADAPPLLLAHGGFDFARTFDVFAPMLADAGWRVVAWDHRGHGDSERAALYAWHADTRDALAVLDSTSAAPIPWVGHSKGASLLTELAAACPDRLTHLVAIDGLPSGREPFGPGDEAWIARMREALGGWRASHAGPAPGERRPGTIDDLARRRARMNPRLSLDWLRYLVTVGARHDADGWRWKVDPALRMGGFGPWRPAWALARLEKIAVPFLAILAGVEEEMGFGTTADDVRPHLPEAAELETFHEVGHFVHIERPREVADLVLRTLAR